MGWEALTGRELRRRVEEAGHAQRALVGVVAGAPEPVRACEIPASAGDEDDSAARTATQRLLQHLADQLVQLLRALLVLLRNQVCRRLTARTVALLHVGRS